ncbi:hypothetical protein DXT99_17800 [Pontibacter diazotrophicus]|uniref:Phosphoribosylpyrophosphate synthetase n=1 Tax=Pontibacter diazotrophicus TaxID=1400979 RepID=A0A3D8L923_9BACT|nr:hypothetical protein [Pontibacter diazotrophicus]RDV13909.1 hypothetical protein DXT99_17800 [Pontibacter diazotrophicus]
MPQYSTFSEAIAAMRDRGYIHTFTIQKGQLFCPELSTTVPPEQLTLIERHEVPSPDTISGTREVFGLRAGDLTLGLMTSTYGEYDAEGFEAVFRRFKTTKGKGA